MTTHDAAAADPRFRTLSEPPDQVFLRLSPERLWGHLQAMQSLTEALLAHLNLTDLLDTLLDRLRSVLRVDTATVLLCSESGDTLLVRASRGLEEEVEQRVAIPMGQGIAGAVAVRRVAVIVDDVARVDTVSPALHRLGSMMVAPLLVEGDILGVLHVGTFQRSSFTDPDLHLIQLVADRVALAIKNALLFDRIRAETARRELTETELRASDQRFRLLVEEVQDYAIFMMDPDGRIASWNEGARRIKGYTQDEIVGEHYSIFFPAADAARGEPQRVLATAAAQGRYAAEGWRVRKDGSRFWASVVVTAIVDDQGRLVGFAKITRDVTDQLRSRQELERLYHEAEAANQAKSDFLAVMSHELRTPLNAIIGYVDLLGSGIPEAIPPAAGAQVVRIGHSARHLLSVIEEILTFSRVEAGKETVHVEPVPLRELTEQVASMIGPIAAGKGLKFTVEVTADPVKLRTDPRKARQILLNLLTNAVKFTPAGEVELRAWMEDDTAVFEVRDTGIGIAEEHRDRVFDSFWQVQQGTTRAAEGMGLGLGLARHLARLLGGDVQLVSTSPSGTCFSARLGGAAPGDPSRRESVA